jgi:hypothetical protein
MAYTRNPTWQDWPDKSTPITAPKLENIETGIVNAATQADAAVAALPGKSDVGHIHDDRYFTEAETTSAIEATGSGATLYVGAGGNDSASGKTWGSAKATIAAAVSALGGPGTVILGDGTFTQSARTIVPSGVTFRGSGPNSIIKLADGVTGQADLFYLNGVSNVRFLDLAFDGNVANQTIADLNTQRGILIQNSDNIIVSRCTFKDHQHQAISVAGATAGNPATHGCSNLSVTDCSFTNVWTALQVTESATDNVRFVNNVVDTTGEHGFTTYAGAQRVLVKGNTFKNVGMRQSPTITTYNAGCGIRIFETVDAVVEGNYIENPNYWGIRITTNATPVQRAQRVSITGNIIRGGARGGVQGGGITVGEQGKAHDVTVAGNIIEGFTAFAGAGGILVLGDRCTVVGNTIRNIANNGITVKGEGCTVAANTLTDTGSYGIQLGGDVACDSPTLSGNVIRGVAAPISRGVYAQSNARNVRMSGNVLVGCTTDVFNGATAPIWQNGEYLVTGIPTAGSFQRGEHLRHPAPFESNISGWVCNTPGTAGTLSSVTGSTTAGTATVTVSSSANLFAGDYITIVGVTGTKRILNVTGTTLTIDSNADATVSGAAVAYSAPVFNVEAESNKYGTLTWDPASLASGASVVSPSISISGAAVGDYVVVAAPYDLQGVMATASVTSSAIVKVTLVNLTGAAVDLASGSWKVKVAKA